jgi:hypothetical protein
LEEACAAILSIHDLVALMQLPGKLMELIEEEGCRRQKRKEELQKRDATAE